MLNGFLRNLSFSSNEKNSIVGENKDINQEIENLKYIKSLKLISCVVSKHGVEDLIASFNSQESIAELFVYLSSHINRKLLDNSFPTINSHYKFDLNNDFSIFIGFIRDYQFVFIFKTSESDMALFSNDIFPEMRFKLHQILN